MAKAETSDIFNCTTEEFYKIIADYSKYPEFLAEVKDCKVVKTENGKKLVEYKVDAIKTFNYKLWMTENEPLSIKWEFAEGDIFKKMKGSWILEPQGTQVKAIYTVEADFSMFVPGPIAKAMVSVNLPNMLKSYHKRVKDVYGK